MGPAPACAGTAWTDLLSPTVGQNWSSVSQSSAKLVAQSQFGAARRGAGEPGVVGSTGEGQSAGEAADRSRNRPAGADRETQSGSRPGTGKTEPGRNLGQGCHASHAIAGDRRGDRNDHSVCDWRRPPLCQCSQTG